uniref:Serine/threonine-protein phosphatase PGAM5, mitochondrial n=1 Tax=Globisporangium ultimum (strain ATCC 200006 / CBS 805.95 / DAOM BR144) TaxID=431595 RepID=K3WI23_GLOUD
MPTQPEAPPIVADDQSLKSHVVRIQDLSLKTSPSSEHLAQEHETPNAKDVTQASVPLCAGERHSEEHKSPSAAVPMVPAPAASSSQPQKASSPLKRKNKRASLSPTSKMKKTTSLSDIVVIEGELVVAEELEQTPQRTAVSRTLGSIYCVLVVRNNSSLHLETVSEHRHHLIDLEISHMDFVYGNALASSDSTLKFQLAYRFQKPSGTPSSYSFTASTKAQYERWTNSIQDFLQLSQQGGGRTSPTTTVSATSSSASAASRASARAESARRMRSIASLCDQPPPPPPPQSNVGTSFLYPRPPKTKHLILVRHGHYINAHARYVSDSDQVLSQMGRQQAEFTGKYLEQLYSRSPTRHDMTIYHSDMTRAVETATSISKDFGNCTLTSTRLLREGWPGRPYSSHQAASSQHEATNPEMDRIDAERMELAFQTIFTPKSADEEDDDEAYSYQVIVCHANLIRFFLCRAMGIDPVGRWGHFEINHCGVTRIDVCENRPLKIISVNETGHLPHSLITSSEDHL